jgi:hypothetical protein
LNNCRPVHAGHFFLPDAGSKLNEPRDDPWADGIVRLIGKN